MDLAKQLFWFTSLTSIIVSAAVCTAGPMDSSELVTPGVLHFTNSANGASFVKYASDTKDATEDDMVTIEYMGSYSLDTSGRFVIKDTRQRAVAMLTEEYSQAYGGELMDILSRNDWVVDYAAFDEALAAAREANAPKAAAREWAESIKIKRRERTEAGQDNSKRYILCDYQPGCSWIGSSICVSHNSRVCNVCIDDDCYDALLPDGC